MKKYLFLILPVFLFLGSCGTAEAEKVADEFHKKFDNGDIEYICDNLLDTEATPEETEGFYDFLSGIRSGGKPENRDKSTGFSKKINGDISTVKLDYTFELEGEEIYEGLVLIDRGDGEGYKIHIVSMHPDKSVVDSYTSGF